MLLVGCCPTMSRDVASSVEQALAAVGGAADLRDRAPPALR